MEIIKGGYKSYPNGFGKNFTDKKHEIVYDFLWKDANYVATKLCGVGQTLGAVEYIVKEFEGILSTRNVRTILKNLEQEGFITIEKRFRGGSIITIVDYKSRHSFSPLKETKKEWSKEKPSKTPKLSYEERGKAWDEENKKRAYIKAGGSPTADKKLVNSVLKQQKESLEHQRNEFIEELKPYVEEYGKEYVGAFFNHCVCT